LNRQTCHECHDRPSERYSEEGFECYCKCHDEADRRYHAFPALVETLEQLERLGREGMKPDPNEWLTFHDKVAQVARAALALAKEETTT